MVEQIILQSADKIFSEYKDGPRSLFCGEKCDSQLEDLWEKIEDAGFPLALLTEEQGGFGVSPLSAMSILQVSGFYSVSVPLLESMLSKWIACQAGLSLPEGISTVAFSDRRFDEYDEKIRINNVRWARYSSSIVTVFPNKDNDTCVAILQKNNVDVMPRNNIAEEPSDTVVIEKGSVAGRLFVVSKSYRDFMAVAAALMSHSMAGVMGRVLEDTVKYSGDRVQFGRPIGKFQAVQQNLAIMAGLVASTKSAAEMAAQSFGGVRGGGEDFLYLSSAAKSIASESSGKVSAIAHQVHGAIGFTLEHSLGVSTKKLWSWRDCYGDEGLWNEVLGRKVLNLEEDGYWKCLTEMGQSAGV